MCTGSNYPGSSRGRGAGGRNFRGACTSSLLFPFLFEEGLVFSSEGIQFSMVRMWCPPLLASVVVSGLPVWVGMGLGDSGFPRGLGGGCDFV